MNCWLRETISSCAHSLFKAMIPLDFKRYALIIIMTFITKQAQSLTLRPWVGERKEK